jgi:G3E family GTPase
MKGNTHRVVFQGVHMLMGGDLGRAWGKDEMRSSTMVFIGKNLPQDLFMKGLGQCLVEKQ